ncbi:hypothetical protein V1264_025052 [Littorina saxatilis]|uniref:Uncharacterized protein n=1 Tax=Littorina saxatilis TaxID=31220 RepID=A0AAN9ALC1_9CAEN
MSSTVVLILLFLSPVAVLGRTAGRRDDNKTKDEDEQLLERMTDAVERGLRFFAQDYSSINVDGLFGMRVGQELLTVKCTPTDQFRRL